MENYVKEFNYEPWNEKICDTIVKFNNKSCENSVLNSFHQNIKNLYENNSFHQNIKNLYENNFNQLQVCI